MSHRARQTESSPVRALLVLGDEALRANVAAVIGGLPGVSETRAIASYGELLAERMDEFDAFIVGESFADAAATDVVGLIREHRDEAPILAALLDDPGGIGGTLLEHGADECVHLGDEHSAYQLRATFEKHLELSRIKRENLRLQAALARSLAELKSKNRELEEQTQRLETIASTDLLTNLANRWRFQERMNPMFAEAIRYGDDLACLMMDLDGFKSINDTMGHQAGDDLLTAVGRVIIEQVRASDLAARIGGDEFVIILPRTNAGTAAALAERIRTQFRRHAQGALGAEKTCGISIGISSISMSNPLDAKQLLSHADNALYAAKRSRTHRVMLCDADGVTGVPINGLRR
ncbi:MAG: GGDEF domain-containing protein [Phycisphaeraceae bacterium]|nr:GGDEF domain-containing protein [Phycisphaeraceae bacterium]MCB9848021.1 GGDEF domain-containing protein [Phycisphaeraceae bacterium]